MRGPLKVTVVSSVPAASKTFLFVPKEDGATGHAPYIETQCAPSIPCDTQYPFACTYSSGLTEFYALLDGRYEYWVNLAPGTTAGEVTVTLRDRTERVVNTWENPAGDPMNERGWHVFDLDGKRGTVTSIDERATGALPGTAYDPNTDVCPDV